MKQAVLALLLSSLVAAAAAAQNAVKQSGLPGSGVPWWSGILPGFHTHRFAGDASLLGNAELRIRLATPYLLLPEQIGVHVLSDVGRVYLHGSSPGGWHSAMGGGLCVSVVDRSFLASISVARSDERTGVYLKGGFSF